MRVLSAILLAVLVVSVASAELLTTANPIGKGSWAVMGAGVQDQNVSNQSGYKMTTFGGYVGYGVTDKLDVYLNASSGNLDGLPAGLTMSMTSIGLNGKYTILEEGKDMPVSVALGLGYKSAPVKSSAAVGGDYNGTQMMGGVGVSKMIIPFVPYAALAYRSSAFDVGAGNMDFTQMDITVGTAVAWSTQGAVFVEYTNQAVTGKNTAVVANHTSGQIAIGVG